MAEHKQIRHIECARHRNIKVQHALLQCTMVTVRRTRINLFNFLNCSTSRVLLNILDFPSCASCSLLMLHVFSSLNSFVFFRHWNGVRSYGGVVDNVTVKIISSFPLKTDPKKIIFWLSSFDIETNNDSKCTLFLISFIAVVQSVIFSRIFLLVAIVLFSLSFLSLLLRSQFKWNSST